MTGNEAIETETIDVVGPNLAALHDICRRLGVRRLDLFGSAATGRFDPARSDLDFLVEFHPQAHGKQHLVLREELEHLFGRKVDLIVDEKIENPYLRRQIETERRALFPGIMISNHAAALLWDAKRAGERVARFTAGRSFDDYLDDEMMRAAVERQFEIIGEALGGLRRVDASLAAQVPDLPQIIVFRNVLIHGYATIDDRAVWDVVQDDLLRLLEMLTRLLEDAPPP